jgi:hypothetical protein
MVIVKGDEMINSVINEELEGPAVSALCIRSRKLSNVGQSLDGYSKIYYLELLRA